MMRWQVAIDLNVQDTVPWPVVRHLLEARSRTHGEGVVDVDETEEGQEGLHEED